MKGSPIARKAGRFRLSLGKLCLLLSLLAMQAAAATLLVEPYPALVYPPFARDKGETGHIDVLTPEFVVEFEDNSSKSIPLQMLFAGIPSNLAIVLAKQTLLNANQREQAILKNMKPGFKKTLITWRSHLRQRRRRLSEDGLSPELRRWLQHNIVSHFRSGTPRSVTAHWWNQIYSVSQPPALEKRELVDSVTHSLRDAV